MLAALEEKWSINFAEIGANYSDKTGVVIDADNAITVGGTALGACSANGDALDSKFLLQTGTTWLLRQAKGLYQGNGGGRAFGLADCKKGQVITIETTGGAPTVGTNVTETSSGTTSVFTVNEDGPVKFNLTRYYYIKSIKIEENVVSGDQKATTYTVKFVDESGNEIKEAATTESYTGETATATANNMADFVAENGKKYIYASGNTTITLVEDAASNVITLVFREAAVYNFTATYVNESGSEIAPAFNGSAFEGDSYSVPFPKFILSEGVMYTKAANSQVYAQTFTPTADGQSTVVTYSNANIDGVVYCQEIEDIEGMSIYGDGNAAVRASNTKVGYNADNDTELTTLPNGVYKIHAGIFDAQKNVSAEFVFTAGETTVMTAKAVNANLNESESEEFTLNSASTPIILKAGGNSLTGVDFVYIIKTGDAELVAPVAAVGKMDFIAMNLPVSSGSGATAVTDGDITENKTFNADDFSVTISPSTTNTPNRFWSATVDGKKGSQLRIYSGTLTVKAAAGKVLDKIVFAAGTWGTMTAGDGTLDGKTWTGNATEVVFTVSKQCQINSITVGEIPAEPIVDAADIAAFKALEAGTRAKLAVNGAKVTFVSGDNTYIEDETGALLLYKAGLTLNAGKAITGFINGAHTVYKGLDELTAIDETPASEISEADAAISATVMTVAEANAVENASKLVKLENVTINADYQTIAQGENEIAFYDKFGVMSGFTYPAEAKSIVGIINTASGYNTFCPVSPDSVVVATAVTPCKEITEDYVFTMTEENVAKAVEETWAKGGATRADNKKGTVDPATGETVEAKTFPGIGLKKGNSSKSFSTCIKGASKVIAYGATGSGTAARYIMVTATPTEGEAVTAKELSQPNNSAVVELKLDATKEYTIEYTGVEEDGTTGGDVALHGVKFIAAGAVVQIPEVANIAAAKDADVRDTEIKLNVTGAKVTLYGGNSMMESFIEDETGAIMVDFNISKLLGADGVALNGYIIGKVTKDQRSGGIFRFESTENTSSSEITKEATTVEPTATTIADITGNTPAEVTSKYIRLENVSVKAEESWGMVSYSLTDGTNELVINDAMWTLPEDMSVVGGFEYINGVVIYGYYGLEFVPYGEFKAVEKQIEFKEVSSIADLKNVESGSDVKLALNNTQITVYEQSRRSVAVYIEDETAGIQILDNDGTIFNEFGKTFNGYIYLKYVNEDGVQNLETTSQTAKSEYTSEVKDVVAKEVALADATSANYDQKLIKVMNVELAVSDADYYVLKDGDNQILLYDMFKKIYDENGDDLSLGKYNVTGIIMGFAEYNDDSSEIIGTVDYFIPTGVAFEEVAEEPVSDIRKWDFTAWSEETKANLAADAATVVPGEDGTYPAVTPWRTYEKVSGPTEAEPDHGGNAYWYGTEINGSEELVANGVVIAETKGLLFNTMTAGSLAIAVNYPSTSLGTYEGPSYLWIGGKNNSFTIPNVKSGSKITLGIESHKNTDARGVKLTINGEEIGSAVPKTYEVFNISVPGQLTDETFSDVVLTNTNGCHIYFITVDATGNDGINDMNAVVKTINNDVYTINGVKVRNAGESLEGLAKGLYIIGGKKVVVK
ncbi:MAG: hypothetical protein K2G86_00245 [Prevotella sp.]|nr:hypothetical protein [Prevotella sp.]